MTQKQKRFIEEYLIDLNATQAAIRAGYSPDTAQQTGSENLSKPVIRAQIDRAMAERSKRTGVNAERVLQELAKIGFADVTDFVTIEGRSVKVKTTDQMPRDKLGAIAGIKEGANGIEIKLNDKEKALELIGRHLGMWNDKVELSGEVKTNNPYEGLTTEELKELIHSG